MDTLWNENYKLKKYPELKEDINCDAAVIGGGLCGMLTAYKLSCAGLKTVLLEAVGIGSGQTCATTAKITVCHDEVFTMLDSKLGKEFTEIYAESEMNSISEYKRIIDTERINCDFDVLPAYMYSLYGERHINAEYESARRAGMNCRITNETSLPFEVALALEFPDQAQFHPLKFIAGIAEKFEIYENSRVKSVSNGKLVCENGTVTAKNIVITTNYPSRFDMRGFFPVKIHRKMAHVYTFKGTDKLDGMYIGIDGGYNYRNANDELIVSGENHISGHGTDSAYERLKKRTLCTFSGAIPSLAWSAEDAVTLDNIPYIGKLKLGAGNVFVATGFGTWGMTSSMTAATLICDLICGRENKAEDMYSLKRFNFSTADELGGMISRAASGIIASKFKIPAEDIKSLPKDFGSIVQYNGRKVAAYRDTEGELHVSEPYCPHMKCELMWNDDDKTWDCPCHGSRFDVDGKLLTGPAESGI